MRLNIEESLLTVFEHNRLLNKTDNFVLYINHNNLEPLSKGTAICYGKITSKIESGYHNQRQFVIDYSTAELREIYNGKVNGQTLVENTHGHQFTIHNYNQYGGIYFTCDNETIKTLNGIETLRDFMVVESMILEKIREEKNKNKKEKLKNK